jgi:Mg/Co/Ni transporter MgtE
VGAQLAGFRPHRADIDGVAVVDEDGRLLSDLVLFDLLVSGAADPIRDLVGDQAPVTVGPDASVEEVADRLIESRRSSLLVVDGGRPLGRILADDIIDALSPEKGRLHFPRLLQ